MWPCGRRCDIGDGLCGFNISHQTELAFLLALIHPVDQLDALSYSSNPLMCHAPAMKIMDLSSVTANKSPVKCFLTKVTLVWCLFAAMEQ